MGMILLVAGLFGGIGLALATLYSLSQTIIARGRLRLLHGALLALTLAVMAALQWGSVPVAQLTALPLLATAVLGIRAEERWYKVFPFLQLLLAVALLLGVVQL